MVKDNEKLTLDAAAKAEAASAKSRKDVNQSFWSLVRHQFKKNKIALAALYEILFSG